MDLLERMERLCSEAQRLGAIAEQSGDVRTALAAVREQSRMVVAIAEIEQRAGDARPFTLADLLLDADEDTPDESDTSQPISDESGG